MPLNIKHLFSGWTLVEICIYFIFLYLFSSEARQQNDGPNNNKAEEFFNEKKSYVFIIVKKYHKITYNKMNYKFNSQF